MAADRSLVGSLPHSDFKGAALNISPLSIIWRRILEGNIILREFFAFWLTKNCLEIVNGCRVS